MSEMSTLYECKNEKVKNETNQKLDEDDWSDFLSEFDETKEENVPSEEVKKFVYQVHESINESSKEKEHEEILDELRKKLATCLQLIQQLDREKLINILEKNYLTGKQKDMLRELMEFSTKGKNKIEESKKERKDDQSIHGPKEYGNRNTLVVRKDTSNLNESSLEPKEYVIGTRSKFVGKDAPSKSENQLTVNMTGIQSKIIGKDTTNQSISQINGNVVWHAPSDSEERKIYIGEKNVFYGVHWSKLKDIQKAFIIKDEIIQYNKHYNSPITHHFLSLLDKHDVTECFALDQTHITPVKFLITYRVMNLKGVRNCPPPKITLERLLRDDLRDDLIDDLRDDLDYYDDSEYLRPNYRYPNYHRNRNYLQLREREREREIKQCQVNFVNIISHDSNPRDEDFIHAITKCFERDTKDAFILIVKIEQYVTNHEYRKIIYDGSIPSATVVCKHLHKYFKGPLEIIHDLSIRV